MRRLRRRTGKEDIVLGWVKSLGESEGEGKRGRRKEPEQGVHSGRQVREGVGEWRHELQLESWEGEREEK